LSVRFLRYEIDAEGHAYQRLALGEETLELYPLLDPISLEHALEVERTILPAIVLLYQEEPRHPAFDGFRLFLERLEAIRRGESEGAAALSEAEARAVDALRAAINDLTPPEEVHRRAFVCFYRHATCDNDVYRTKALTSLERLVARVSDLHEGER
jgi:hypothetical protein